MGKKYKSKFSKIDTLIVVYIFLMFIIRAFLATETGYAIMCSDEVCHWGLSRSIFDSGKTYIRGIPADRFSCLYSISIAWVHAFSNYELQYTITYIVNALFMVSTLIPFYLLCKRIFKDEKKACGLVILVSLLPEFAYNARILQENLFFPIVMWTFYFMYCFFEDEVFHFKSSICMAILSFLCYWARQAGICITIAVIVLMIWNMLYEKKVKLYLKQILIFITAFLGIYIITAQIYKVINPDMVSTDTLSRILFGINRDYIIYWLEGGFRYMIILLIVTGFFTMLTPFLIFRKLSLAEQRLTIFVTSVASFAILESVGMFYINESMQRIHLRYIFYVIPVILALGIEAFCVYCENKIIIGKIQTIVIVCYSMIGIAVLISLNCFCVSGSPIDGNSNRFLMTNSILSQWFDMSIYETAAKIVLILFIFINMVLLLKAQCKKIVVIITCYFCIIQVANNYLCYATEYNYKQSSIAKIVNDSEELDEYLNNTVKNKEMVALITENYLGHMIELHISNFPLYIISYEQLLADAGNTGLLPNNQIQYQGFGINELKAPADYILLNKATEIPFLSYEVVFESSNYRVWKKTNDTFAIKSTISYEITGLTEDKWITDTSVDITINSEEEIKGIQFKFHYLTDTKLGITDSNGNEYFYNLAECNGIVKYFVDDENVTSIQLTLYGVETAKPSEIYGSSDERNLCAQLLSLRKII